MKMNNSIIEVKNLSKLYKLYDKPIDRMKESLSLTRKKYHKEHYALKGVSFTVNKGETVGIIGTNGAGKSTLLKILTGVLNSTEGIVNVNGRISALLELGAGFNLEYTGIENIYLNGTMMGYSKEEIEEKIPSVLEFADIGEFVYQPVKTYSSGMFARLAFSVAINVEPEILIVDEALSVGDVFFQNKCFRKLEELKGKGVTILFVSHDLNSIKQMCSKVLWIEKGQQLMYEESDIVCRSYFNEKLKKESIEVINKVEQIKLDSDYETGIINIEKKSLKKLEPKTSDIISNQLEIISISMINSKNEITNILNAGEECKINIIIEAKQKIENLIVGFVIENIKGIGVIGDNTYSKNKQNFSVDKDEVKCIEFKFYMPYLKKEEYILNVAVAVGTQELHSNLVWMHGVMSFNLTKDSYDLALLDARSSIDVQEVRYL